MAVVESIPEKNQSPSAQEGVLDYCMQPSKTFDESEQLAYISGYNCVPQVANESFLTTQKVFGHAAGGVRFYHFVQSFVPRENISPQEANEIGMELAKSFGNREAIVATHIDRKHLHNHIVVCAYDLADGRKLHYNKFFLSDLRKASDEICKAHGFEVLQKYNPSIRSGRVKPKEYRAALNGNSWKMALCATIDFCMTKAKTRDEFQGEMKKYGYEMVWTPERKYITYILCGKDGTEKRVTEILTDTSSGFSTDEECEKWKNRQKERAELEAERKHQERLLLDTWFEQERYIKGSWWKRIWLSLVYLAKDTCGEGRLPDFVAKDIARCLLPNILAYFESEEGKKAFHAWMEKKNTRQIEKLNPDIKKDGA